MFDLFEEEDGLDALFGLIREALPERLYETAYALACDVVAADGTTPRWSFGMLEEMRDELNIDRLHAAAIEWARAGPAHAALTAPGPQSPRRRTTRSSMKSASAAAAGDRRGAPSSAISASASAGQPRSGPSTCNPGATIARGITA